MTALAVAAFALSLAVCLFVYFGYPAVLYVLSRLRPRPVGRAEIRPLVSVIIPAHNEEAVIRDKLANSLALRYPADRLEVLVVSDGSTDSTEELVADSGDPRVRLLALPRQGKVRAVAAGVEAAHGEIIVLTDANSILEPDSLAILVESFADPAVGGVCGNKKYRSSVHGDTTEEGENLYWRFDKWQKGLESSIGSIFAADGAFYAIRKSLFVAVDDPAQADDIAFSTRVVLQGYRLLYEPRAVAWEPAPAEGRLEFARKVRVTNHSVRALLNLGRALWTSGFYSFELLSHKLVRHFVPFFLIGLLLSNVALVRAHPVFALSLAAQLAFYGVGLLGFLLRDRRWGRSRLLSVPYFFTLVNAAALVGILSIWAGKRHVTWTPRAS